jgi:hypothetical protein
MTLKNKKWNDVVRKIQSCIDFRNFVDTFSSLEDFVFPKTQMGFCSVLTTRKSLMSDHARRLLDFIFRRHVTKRAGLMNLNQDPAQNDLSQTKSVQSQVSQLHAGTAGLQLRISCLHSSYFLWLLDWVQVCPQPLSVVVIDMNLQNHALPNVLTLQQLLYHK